MSEYVDIIRNLINPELPVGIGELPYKNRNRIDNQIIDTSLLVKDTGYVPDYDFEDGIRLVIDEYKR